MNFNLLKYRKMYFKDFIFFPLLIRELLIFFYFFHLHFKRYCFKNTVDLLLMSKFRKKNWVLYKFNFLLSKEMLFKKHSFLLVYFFHIFLRNTFLKSNTL